MLFQSIYRQEVFYICAHCTDRKCFISVLTVQTGSVHICIPKSSNISIKTTNYIYKLKSKLTLVYLDLSLHRICSFNRDRWWFTSKVGGGWPIAYMRGLKCVPLLSYHAAEVRRGQLSSVFPNAHLVSPPTPQMHISRVAQLPKMQSWSRVKLYTWQMLIWQIYNLSNEHLSIWVSQMRVWWVGRPTHQMCIWASEIRIWRLATNFAFGKLGKHTLHS